MMTETGNKLPFSQVMRLLYPSEKYPECFNIVQIPADTMVTDLFPAASEGIIRSIAEDASKPISRITGANRRADMCSDLVPLMLAAVDEADGGKPLSAERQAMLDQFSQELTAKTAERLAAYGYLPADTSNSEPASELASHIRSGIGEACRNAMFSEHDFDEAILDEIAWYAARAVYLLFSSQRSQPGVPAN